MSEISERLQEAWANLRLGVRVILVILVLGLAIVLLARPLRATLRALALDRNSRLAEAALLAGDANEARSRSLTAIQSAPDRPDLTRTLLVAMDRLNDPKRVQVATILIGHPAATAADKQLALAILAGHAPLVVVGAAWEVLPPAAQAAPEMIDLFARRLLDEGKSAQATLLLKGLDLSNPPDFVSRLLLDLLVSQGSGDAWEECQKLLIRRTQAATSAGEAVPDWCLAGWERVPQEFLHPQALTALPAAGPPRLNMLRRRFTLDREPLDLQAPEIAGWLRDAAAADRLPLAVLLAGGDQLDTAVALLQRGPGLTRAEYEWLRSTRLRTPDWRTWRDFLQSPAVAEVPQVWVKADLALAHLQLDEAEASKTAWNEALQLAASSAQAPRLTDLSRRVRMLMPERSRDAMLAAIRTPGQALPLFNDLNDLMGALEHESRDTDLLDICRVYRVLEPSNPVAITRYAYLALLAGELPPAAAVRLVEPVIQYQPHSPHPRVVAILATLLLDQPGAATGWIARDQVTWHRTPPFYQWLVARAETPDASPTLPAGDGLLPSEAKAIEKLR